MSDEHPTGYVDLTTPDPAPAAPVEEAPVDLPPTEATDAVPTPEAPAPAPAPTKQPHSTWTLCPICVKPCKPTRRKTEPRRIHHGV